MSKILYITNISNGVSSFSVAAVTAARKLGYEFYLAGNFSAVSPEKLKSDEVKYGVHIVNIDLARSPYSQKNLRAYKQLIEFVKKEKIDYIHCNTPVGGILGRLVGEKCKVKRVIYQVHGFHFYNGAPKKNWLLYYPVEKWLAKKTDAIITINNDDYDKAKGFKLKNHGKIYYVPGVGIDTSDYENVNDTRITKRKELGINEDIFVIISAGELNKNKNNEVIIRALAELKDNNCIYLVCGVGSEREYLEKLVEDNHMKENVIFLGYRSDMKELMSMSDVFVMPSYREGLSRSIMEAMASGLPCIVSEIRGNRDLIDINMGGYRCKTFDVEGFKKYIDKLNKNRELVVQMGNYNRTKIEEFSLQRVITLLSDIYITEFNV